MFSEILVQNETQRKRIPEDFTRPVRDFMNQLTSQFLKKQKRVLV
jgi:hypothetical protein